MRRGGDSRVLPTGKDRGGHRGMAVSGWPRGEASGETDTLALGSWTSSLQNSEGSLCVSPQCAVRGLAAPTD